jgi:hypothetical protein
VIKIIVGFTIDWHRGWDGRIKYGLFCWCSVIRTGGNGEGVCLRDAPSCAFRLLSTEGLVSRARSTNTLGRRCAGVQFVSKRTNSSKTPVSHEQGWYGLYLYERVPGSRSATYPDHAWSIKH